MSIASTGRLIAAFWCVAALWLAGCKPKPPASGYTVVVELDLSNVAAEKRATAVEQARGALVARIDRLGIPAFAENGQTNPIVLNIPRVSTNVLEEVKSVSSRSCEVEFRMVHRQNDELAALRVTPPGYELKEPRASAGAVQPHLVEKRGIPNLSGEQFKAVTAQRNSVGQPEIAFEFDETGRAAFADVTRTNVGQKLAILVDGELYAAPVIREPILGGAGVISGGNMHPRDAYLFAVMLEHSIPVPIRLVDVRTY